jgi:enediyne biosynthesis protein E5
MKPSRVVAYFRTPKGMLLLILAGLTAVAFPVDGWAAVARMVLGAAVAAGLEVALANDRKKVGLPDGAILTGFIVAMVMSQTAPVYAVVLAAGLAILSKHILRVKGGHIFNPSAAGLLVVALLFSSEQSWWGGLGDLPAPFIVLVLLAGALIVERTNKWTSVLTFAGVYFGLLTAFSVFGDPLGVADAFREPMSGAAVYFALFMLTDPPTSPARPSDQVWFGAAVGAASLLCLALAPTAVYYLLVGLLAGNALEAARRTLATRRRGKRAAYVDRGFPASRAA